MKLSSSIALLLTSALCGCAGMDARISSSHDRFADKTINETKVNNLPMAFGDPGQILLNMRQEIDGTGHSNYFLILSSSSVTGWQVFPNPMGQSLFVLADGNRFSFTSSICQGSLYFYPATEDQLRAIANASSVEVRVVQVSGDPFEKRCAPKNRENFKRFADEFLK